MKHYLTYKVWYEPTVTLQFRLVLNQVQGEFLLKAHRIWYVKRVDSQFFFFTEKVLAQMVEIQQAIIVQSQDNI